MLYVVTGSRGGIGLEVVRQLTQDPSNTIIAVVRSLDADISALQAIKQSSGARVHLLECDVGSADSAKQLAINLGELLGSTKIDILINNAAILGWREETSLNLSTNALVSHITTNVMGPAMVVQNLLPYLAPRAVIANITSGAGSMAMLSEGRIKAENTPYGISKAALNMLTIHQAKSLREKTVVCIDPGHVKTVMGGPNAVLEVPDSAKGVIAVISNLSSQDSGSFLLYDGTKLPW